MPDICDLVLDDHEMFRRRFSELDDKRAGSASADDLDTVWGPLAGALERHASAEEQLFYPKLLARGAHAKEETEDAIDDHNTIRSAIARAAECDVGEDDWWSAVLEARQANSDHIAEEEREALPDFREHVDIEVRDDLGGRWLRYQQAHAGGRGLHLEAKDVGDYLERPG